jgi:uncharacterized protein DUF4145
MGSTVPEETEVKEVKDCPHCEAKTTHLRVMRQTARFTHNHKLRDLNEPGKRLEIAVLKHHELWKCENCRDFTYYLVTDPDWAHDIGVSGDVDPQGIPLILAQSPAASPLNYRALPDDVADAAWEAEKCLSVAAYNACGTMARRAVDALCIDKGATGRDLYDRLDDLKRRGIISDQLWQWADEIRHGGKVGAHPDWEEMNGEDAKRAIGLLRELLRFVYISPAELSGRTFAQKPKRRP